jgi:hypothetical protein
LCQKIAATKIDLPRTTTAEVREKEREEKRGTREYESLGRKEKEDVEQEGGP